MLQFSRTSVYCLEFVLIYDNCLAWMYLIINLVHHRMQFILRFNLYGTLVRDLLVKQKRLIVVHEHRVYGALDFFRWFLSATIIEVVLLTICVLFLFPSWSLYYSLNSDCYYYLCISPQYITFLEHSYLKKGLKRMLLIKSTRQACFIYL